MTDGETVEIQVVSRDESADADSLAAWLQSGASALRPGAVWRRDEGPLIEADSMQGVQGRQMVVVSLGLLLGPAVGAFVSDLTAFLRARDDITLEVATGAGETIALRGGETAERVARIIEPLVATTSGGSGGVELGASNASTERRLIPILGAAGSAEGDGSGHRVSASIGGLTLPVTIYLSEEQIHDQVEEAVDELVAIVGLQVDDRDEPVIGSWFRRMRAAAKEVTRSPAAREAALTAAHAADTRLVLAQDAAVTATLLQNLGPVIASLQPTRDAVLRIGALLIVKVDWAVSVFQLTAAQQALLDHRPQLASSPHEIIAALNLTPSSEESKPQALH